MAADLAPDLPPVSLFRSTRSTKEESQQKRAALLHAAVRMFNERGFHATSLDDVAAALGVTKPVIYHHLGNKDQVLFECVRIGLEELRSAAEEARKVSGSGLERLRTFLECYAVIIMGEFGSCVIRTGEEALSAETRVQFRSLKRQIDDELRVMISEAAADGSADVSDVRVTALAWSGALNWPARWFRPDGALSPQAMAQALVATLIAGVDPRRE